MAPFDAAQEKLLTKLSIKYYRQNLDIPKTRIAVKFTVSYYLHRNKSLYKSLRSKTLANERKQAHQTEDIQRHLTDFKDMLEEYQIRQADVWNFDEIGFRIGCLKRGL